MSPRKPAGPKLGPRQQDKQHPKKKNKPSKRARRKTRPDRSTDQSTRAEPKRSRKKTRRPNGKKGRSPAASTDAGRGERLQKLLAAAGLGSRRTLEDRIAAGAVRLNGRPAALGARAGAGDRIEIDGKLFEVSFTRPAHRTLIYHKPEGEITTRDDPEGRKTVFENLPRLHGARWIAVGRLDLNTAGLLLLTTDGELANRMMHPAGRVDREYLCRIRGKLTGEQIERLLAGVDLDDGRANFSDLVAGQSTTGHTWYTVTIMEGRNREVRRLWEAVGAQVARLKRVRFGPVFLPSRLRPGQFEEIKPADQRILREDVGLPGRSAQLTLRQIEATKNRKKR